MTDHRRTPPPDPAAATYTPDRVPASPGPANHQHDAHTNHDHGPGDVGHRSHWAELENYAHNPRKQDGR